MPAIQQPFVLFDKLSRTASVMTATDIAQIDDAPLEACLNGEAIIVRWNGEEEVHEHLEFINDLIPNWVQLPCDG